MRESFFPLTLLHSSRQEQSRTPKCGECGLKDQTPRPMIPPTGKGKRKILVVTDRTGPDEEAGGQHLSGGYGRMVTDTFRKYGIDLREDCWSTAASICRPRGKTPANVIDHCRGSLFSTIDKLKPEVIVLLGESAVKSLVGGVWRESVGTEERWAGYRIPHGGLNAWICPTFHPSTLKADRSGVCELFFGRHLEAVSKLKGRPYAEGDRPDYGRMVRVVVGEGDAVKELRRIVSGNNTLAWDYETTCLKPDGPHAEIVSCSVSNGEISVAFPWRGKAIEEMKRILVNPKIRKIASNAKFEDRWTRKVLGVRVRGWWWDTMLAAHALENNTKTKQIASIKFQAFVHLGVDSWDGVVGPYLKSKGGEDKRGNAPNRIKEVDLPSLLRYNALDSLYEFLIARIQYRTLKSMT